MAMQEAKSSGSLPFIAAGMAAVAVVGAVALAVLFRGPETERTEPAASVPEIVAEALAQSGLPMPAAPQFDVVRVSPEGRTVIAGRAAPGAEVIVREAETEVARTRADRQGAFVAMPDAPLAPGGRELTLSARSGGGEEVKGDGSVVLVVPTPRAKAVVVPDAPVAAPEPVIAVVPNAPVAAPEPVVALLVPSAAPPRVLHEPVRNAAREAAPSLTLDTVDYDDQGAIRFRGGAAAGAALRVYVDNGLIGEGRAGANGRWVLTPEDGVSLGVHRIRVDQLDDTGRVVMRIELPFQRVALAEAADSKGVAGGRVVVQPGQNLWRLARIAYGQGMRYRVIYLANRDQIRDPKLIYPGQAFTVPKK